MTAAEIVAEQLSEPQRRLLLKMPGKYGNGRGMAGAALERKGLTADCPRYAFQHVLTPLGDAVLDILRAKENAHDQR